MFGWSSAPVSDAVPADGATSRTESLVGRGALTRLLIDRIQDGRHDPFALVMLELVGRPSAGRGTWLTLPAAAHEAVLRKLFERLRQHRTTGSLDEHLTVLILSGVDTRAALEPLRLALSECCQHSVLADRECYSVRWRLAAALYPADGHAPCRLLRDVQTQLRAAPWSDAGQARPAGATPPRTSATERFRVPVATDPLALV